MVSRCPQWPERGMEAEERWLAGYDFYFQKDANEDLYYVGPLGHIIHLYPEGEWDSDKAGSCESLEEYLSWLATRLAAF
jgi:hypothetical protein